MKKKILLFMLCGVMVFTLTGCGNNLINKNSKNNNEKSTTEENTTTKNPQILRDVAKVGDYVNYLGSDTNWRIIYISDDSFDKKEVHLVYSTYLVDNWEPTNNSYEQVLEYLKSTNEYNNYLDSKYAEKVYTSIPTRDFEFHFAENYKNVPDLYDVGADINLAGEKYINYFTSRLAFYKNGSGEVSGTDGWEHNIRPTVYLKVNIGTTGKNKNGAWVLSDVVEEEETIKKNTGIEFSPTVLGSYSYDDKGNTIILKLKKENDNYAYNIEYYPNGSAHASEELWGNWDTTKRSFDLENENTTSLAKYKISNIVYHGTYIEFDLKATEVINNDYKDYIIPDGSYNLSK